MTEDYDFLAAPSKKKPGRKADPNRVRLVSVSFKMPEALHAKMLGKAKRNGRSQSEWLRESSTQYNPRRPSADA